MTTNGMKLFLLGIALTLAGRADTSTIATIRVTNPTGTFTDSESFDADFTLLVTGGTGTAFFIPNLYANGDISEDWGGGSSWGTAYSNLSVNGMGGPSVYAPTANSTNATCTFDFDGSDSNCGRVYFTFGVPEDIRVTGHADVGYACAGLYPGQSCVGASGGLSASAGFSGISAFFEVFPGAPTIRINPTYYLIPAGDPLPILLDTTPEPASFWLLCAGGLGLAARWMRRNRTLLSRSPM